MSRRFWHGIGQAEEYALCLMVLQMGISVFVQVVMRYVFHSAITWLAELVHIEIVFLTFFGASLAVKYGSHICVDVLKTAFREPYQSLLDAVNHLIVAAYGALIILFGARLIKEMIPYPHYTPTLRIPKHYLYFMVCVAMGFLCARSLYKSYQIFTAVLTGKKAEAAE